MVALRDAVASLPATLDGIRGIKPDRLEANRPHYDPSKAIIETVAAVSVGYVGDQPYLDLDYPLDSKAGVDFNIAMTSSGKFVELQGAGENGQCFTPDQLTTLLSLGRRGCDTLFDLIRKA
jgi:ribonuclease PH